MRPPVLALILSALAALLPAGSATVRQGPVTLTATARPTAPAGETIPVTVSVTNTSHTALAYELPTPCDSLYRITVTGAAGHPVATLRHPQPGTVCAQVIARRTLAPGATLTERFAWRTAGVAPGAYTLRADPAPTGGPLPTVAFTVTLR